MAFDELDVITGKIQTNPSANTQKSSGGGLLNNNFEELSSSETRKSHYSELINMSFDQKVYWARTRVKEFLLDLDKYFTETKTPEYAREVLVSFSGGKDSTVLLDIVAKVHKEIGSKIYIVPAYAYEITFPETIKFIKDVVAKYNQDNSYIKSLHFAKPKISWYEILSKHGYPIFSKQVSVLLNRIKRNKSKSGLTSWIFGIDTVRFDFTKPRMFLLDDKMKTFPHDEGIDYEYFGHTYDNNDYTYSEKCCDFVKGGLKHDKRPAFVGTMAEESQLRKNSWIKYGCNIMNERKKVSRPLSIFKTSDIWKYIYYNHVDINQKYGFDFNRPIDKKAEVDTSYLKYKRLGCISCPYGAHIEQNDVDAMKLESNRFEVLLEESPLLYKAQVIDNGMYKVLIDMKIKIPKDEKYMYLYKKRWEQIDEWYMNFDENLLDIITQVENYKNYKNYDLTKKKFQKANWNYSFDEVLTIMKHYKSNWDEQRILNKLRELRREKLMKNFK